MIATAIVKTGQPQNGTALALFQVVPPISSFGRRQHSVSTDGRFLLNARSDQQSFP